MTIHSSPLASGSAIVGFAAVTFANTLHNPRRSALPLQICSTGKAAHASRVAKTPRCLLWRKPAILSEVGQVRRGLRAHGVQHGNRVAARDRRKPRVGLVDGR
eukprot:3252964-Pyramimonas_sp.AAC.1